MKLKKISIKQFRCFDNFQIEVPQNLQIVGKNGSGKSTICEAVNFCLFGSRSLRSKLATFPLGMSVEVEFEEFKISRSRSNVSVKDTNISGAQLVEQFLRNKGLLPERSWLFFSFQGELKKFFESPPRVRRNLLESFVGFDRVSKAIELCARKIEGIPKDFKVLKDRLQKLRTEVKYSPELFDKFKRLEHLRTINSVEDVSHELRSQEKKLEEAQDLRALQALRERAVREQKCPVCGSQVYELPNINIPDISVLRMKIEKLRQKLFLFEQSQLLENEKMQLEREVGYLPREELQRSKEAAEQMRAIEQMLSGWQSDDIEIFLQTKSLLEEYRKVLLYFIFNLVFERLSRVLSFGKFKLNEKFEILCDNRPIETFSAGEMAVMSVAFRILFSEEVAKQTGFGFVFLDSVCDELDDENIQAVVQLIEDLNLQKVVFSHFALPLSFEVYNLS